MLISNGSEIVRLQCAFVDTPEVERIVEFIGNQQGYPSAFELPEYEGADGGDLANGNSKSLTNIDDMFEQCARLVVSSGSGSTSMLQRRFNLGYNRAGRIMDQLESAGIVGASTGGKPRELMVHTESELDEVLRAILKY
jgi:S-DNA-T family DNA segregation ATPase FtsK/SpoIIIE